MQLMSRGHVSDCTGTDFLLIGDAAAAPFFVCEMFEKVYRSATYRRQFFDEALEGSGIEVRIGHVIILFKTRQPCFVVATDTQRAIRKDPLGVDEVPQNLLDGPLSFGVGASRVFFRLGSQERQRVFDL